MEIGSAYALQVCLIQAPAMLAFSAFYSIGKISMEHRAFTYVPPSHTFSPLSDTNGGRSSLVFPRWDVIAIIFSVFLLTYTYIEARANYYRGTILCLSYVSLLLCSTSDVGADTWSSWVDSSLPPRGGTRRTTRFSTSTLMPVFLF